MVTAPRTHDAWSIHPDVGVHGRIVVCVAPPLLSWIADRKHTEMMLLKEDRKLAAERAYALGLSKPPADDG